MMENANLTLADAATRSRYAQIIVTCDELIAQLTWIPPQTGGQLLTATVLELVGSLPIRYNLYQLPQQTTQTE